MLANTRFVIGVVSFGLALTGMFLGNMFLVMMIGEINRKRQDGNLVSYFGFTPSKMWQIFGEYRSSYPKGKAHIYFLVSLALAMAGLVSVAVCLRIIG